MKERRFWKGGEISQIVSVGYNKVTTYVELELNRHGLKFDRYYVDEDDCFDDNERCLPFENILLEDAEKTCIIITTRNDIFKKMSKLLDWGFELEKIHVMDIDRERGTKGKECYDVFLGYTRKDDENGFTIFGNKESKYKIVTLGGSTTDATCSGLCSWSEMLYSRVKGMGEGDISVWCAGMGSFSSGQELIKLIRDVMVLKPSIVISYSGFNDIYCDYIGYMSSDDRFVCNYQYEFLKKALNKKIINSYNPKVKVSNVVTGYNSNRDIVDHWIENERMMKGICEINNIAFFSFFQPCRIYEEACHGYESDLHQHFMEKYRLLKEKLNMEENLFIKDLSDVFLNKKNIYTDECHVYESGNRIICDNVYMNICKHLRKILRSNEE